MPYVYQYIQHRDQTPLANRRIVFTNFLQCAQCTAVMPHKNNQRCSRRVCMGLPYCHSHVTKLLKVKVMPSTIPNAGKGLFAFQSGVKQTDPDYPPVVFTANDIICPYAGEVVNENVLNQRYGPHTAHYAAKLFVPRRGLRANQKLYEDAALHRGIGAFPNHSSQHQHRNARLVFDDVSVPGKVFAEIQATRTIRHGEEIFVSYGPEYIGPGQRITMEGPFHMQSNTVTWRNGKPLPQTQPFEPMPPTQQRRGRSVRGG